MMSESFLITGQEDIEHARWLVVRSALKLEIKGLRRSRGSSARQLANKITGADCRKASDAYEVLNATIVAVMGAQFDKPLEKS